MSNIALFVLFFAEIIAVGLVLGIKSCFPVFEKAEKIHKNITYFLPALAVFALSLVFVKINKKYFHLTLGKIIFRYIVLLDYGLDINYKEEMGRNLRDYARRFKYDLER